MEDANFDNISQNIHFSDVDENAVEPAKTLTINGNVEGIEAEEVTRHELPTATYEPDYFNDKNNGILNNALIQCIQSVPAVMNQAETDNLVVPVIYMDAELEITREDTNTVHLSKTVVMYEIGEVVQETLPSEDGGEV